MKETADRDIVGSRSALLHMLLGEASFALALLRATDAMPQQGRTVLARLAENLTLSTETVRTTSRAVGEIDRLDLAIAANSVFAAAGLESLGEQLDSTAADLRRIINDADQGNPIPPSLLEDTITTLQRIEDTVAAMEAVPTDEVIRGEGWLGP